MKNLNIHNMVKGSGSLGRIVPKGNTKVNFKAVADPKPIMPKGAAVNMPKGKYVYPNTYAKSKY